MTAHCQPNKYPEDPDLTEALDIWDICRNEAEPLTKRVFAIRDRIADLRRGPEAAGAMAQRGLGT